MMKRQTDSGVALITAMLMLALISALLVGATALVISEQKNRFQDHDRTQAFEGAHSGLEKLTNDLGDLFSKTYAPTTTQITALQTQQPTMAGISFTAPGGAAGSGYTITQGTMAPRTLTTGTYSGLTALVTPYTINVTAKTLTAGEVSLQRTLNTVSIPVFQFGIFSDTDLSFFPGPQFDFGGRVHTNGNLFLAKGNGNIPGTSTPSELILGDRVTAVGDVVRKYLSNDVPISTAYTNVVRIAAVDGGCSSPNAPGQPNWATNCRSMLDTEGSVVGKVGSATTGPSPSWNQISTDPTYYFNHIKNRLTGVTPLNLPLAGQGARPIDLIARPAVGEDTAGAIYGQRYYQYASLRILISDQAADITGLPGASSGSPIALATIASGTYASGPAIAHFDAATASISGYIKIDKQNAAGGGWTDVTTSILNQGYVGASIKSGCSTVPHPSAIIRLQRPRRSLAGCTGTTSGIDYGPLALYDAREGLMRDSRFQYGSTMHWEGVMQYVELDVKNLRNWLIAQADIMNTTGFVVYFSDRRGSHDASGNNTGELRYEDIINPSSMTGVVDNALQTAEDVNGNGTLEVDGLHTRNWPTDTRLLTGDVTASDAEYRETPFFRRALKLVNGNRANMIGTTTASTLGLTVAAENPVYVQGDYNGTMSENSAALPWNSTYDNTHVGTAVVADAVTLLSNNWSDLNSFNSPNDKAGRVATPTVYRTAIISGKNKSFAQPSWSGCVAASDQCPSNDLGTDGGTHNFLRFLEDWGSINIFYRGSMVSFFYSVEATGIFKCCNSVYGAPRRNFSFDTDFLTPALLPPRTPMVRDINTTGFSKLSGPTSP